MRESFFKTRDLELMQGEASSANETLQTDLDDLNSRATAFFVQTNKSVTLESGNQVIEATNSGITISLYPTPAAETQVTIKNSSGGTITIDNGTIDSDTSLDLAAGEAATLFFNGTIWLVI